MTNILYKKQNKVVRNDGAPISVKDEVRCSLFSLQHFSKFAAIINE